MYKSTGILKYFKEPELKVIVEVDQQLADYYRSLIPKYYYVSRQKYNAHISVVRKEIPTDLTLWGIHEDEEVEFYYDNQIKRGKVYFWINVFCKRLEEIRLELKLPVNSPYTLPPEGFVKCFHCTIGNVKNV